MKTLKHLLFVAAAAAFLAGCSGGTDSGGTTDPAAATPKTSKEGAVTAQAGELQPPPNAPDPEKIAGSAMGGK